MLCLTRRKNQKIFIGDDIEIEITAVEGKNVVVGIKAPKNVPIHRDERRHQNERLQTKENGRIK